MHPDASRVIYTIFNIENILAAQKPKMKSHYRGHKMAVWLNLIPQLHQPGDEDVSMRHHHFYEREPHFYAGKSVVPNRPPDLSDLAPAKRSIHIANPSV